MVSLGYLRSTVEEAAWKGVCRRSQALDFITARLAPALLKNDGKQTPMRGHPVFIAQHATATCCRRCLWKWYQGKKYGFFINCIG